MKIKDLENSSIWRFVTDGDRNAYVMYRFGRLSVRVSAEPGGDATEGIEILGLEISDGVEWRAILKLIKGIDVEVTLQSLRNNR